MQIQFTPEAWRALKSSTLDGAVKTALSLGGPKVAFTAFEMLAAEGAPLKGAVAAWFITAVCAHFLQHAYNYVRSVFYEEYDGVGKEINDYLVSFMVVCLAIAFSKALLADATTAIAILAVGFSCASIIFVVLAQSESFQQIKGLKIMLIARVLVIMPSVLIQGGRYDCACAIVVVAFFFVSLYGGKQKKVQELVSGGFEEFTSNGVELRKTTKERLGMGLGFWLSGVVCSWLVGFFQPTQPTLTVQEPWVCCFVVLFIVVFAFTTDLKLTTIRAMLMIFVTSQSSSVLSYALKGTYPRFVPSFCMIDLMEIYSIFFLILTLLGLKFIKENGTVMVEKPKPLPKK